MRTRAGLICKGDFFNRPLSCAAETTHIFLGDRAVLKPASVVALQVQRQRSAHLRRSFQQWAHATAQTRHCAALLRKTVGRFRHRQIAAAFSCWREETRDRKRRRGLLNRAVQRMNQRCLSTAFLGWRTRVQALRKLEGALGKVARRWRHVRLGGSWDTWREAVREGRALRAKLDKVVRRMRVREKPLCSGLQMDLPPAPCIASLLGSCQGVLRNLPEGELLKERPVLESHSIQSGSSSKHKEFVDQQSHVYK
jgi:hypothetical protein